MSLNPGGMSYGWNHTNRENPEFSLELVGTVVAIQEKQHMNWNNTGGSRTPAFWDNGDPKMDIRIAFATPEGQLKTFQFGKASRKQSQNPRNTHVMLANLGNGRMENLIGKTIHIMTWDVNPETGQAWGLGNPRLYTAGIVPDVTYELAEPLPDEFKVPKLYADNGASGGQSAAPQMHGNFYAGPRVQQPPMQQYQQPYMPLPQQPYQLQPQQPSMQQYQQPYMPMPQQPYQPQPQQQPPMQQMPTVQQMPPIPQTAQMPQGMDPMVAQAMRAVGAQNVQPYSDIPF